MAELEYKSVEMHRTWVRLSLHNDSPTAYNGTLNCSAQKFQGLKTERRTVQAVQHYRGDLHSYATVDVQESLSGKCFAVVKGLK